MHYEDLARECYDHFKVYFKNSYVFSVVDSVRTYAIKEAINKNENTDLYMEFGVWKGSSINLFASSLLKNNSTIHGFDSCAGLRDDGSSSVFVPKGTFNLKKQLPSVKKNVNLIKGWIEETLPNFLKENNNTKIAFIHFDMDTYKSTAFAIKTLKPFFKTGTIILFDQLHSYPHWKEHEFKALNDTLKSDEYKFIAFGVRQACIEIL